MFEVYSLSDQLSCRPIFSRQFTIKYLVLLGRSPTIHVGVVAEGVCLFLPRWKGVRAVKNFIEFLKVLAPNLKYFAEIIKALAELIRSIKD